MYEVRSVCHRQTKKFVHNDEASETQFWLHLHLSLPSSSDSDDESIFNFKKLMLCPFYATWTRLNEAAAIGGVVVIVADANALQSSDAE